MPMPPRASLGIVFCRITRTSPIPIWRLKKRQRATAAPSCSSAGACGSCSGQQATGGGCTATIEKNSPQSAPNWNRRANNEVDSTARQLELVGRDGDMAGFDPAISDERRRLTNIHKEYTTMARTYYDVDGYPIRSNGNGAGWAM